MALFRPTEPFSTRAELLKPNYKTVKGVTVKEYEPIGYINCSFKTYGGTETTVNDLYSLIDTAEVVTWYRPDIEANTRIKVNGKAYEVLGTPENISMRNQYLKFKVKAVNGGA